ncbi:MAG: hypothetical protein DRH57_05645 [Candidatus Cloacimonadota bacterium]|nr:MAG: hypothetical protein DRH57_05645 [Candidatus Cloacimonadota bacterium]
MDLKYKNKEGITLQKVFSAIKSNDRLSKKDLTNAVKAKKSIDTLINKLLDANLILKVKDGRSVMYKLVEQISLDKSVIIPVDKSLKKLTAEVNQEDLDYLKQEMENIEGKPVTAILHTRNEKKPKKEHIHIDKIYEANKSEEYILDKENPFRFVLNFFTSTLNGELSTPHFKRRDNYVVKSIYNKFKTVCDKMDKYDTEQQHIPFYRAFTIDKDTLTVKMYHIDMNRVIRGYHNLFQLSEDDKKFIFGDK